MELLLQPFLWYLFFRISLYLSEENSYRKILLRLNSDFFCLNESQSGNNDLLDPLLFLIKPYER